MTFCQLYENVGGFKIIFENLKIIAKSTALAASILCLGVMGSSVSAIANISGYQKDIANAVSYYAPATIDELIERVSFVLDIARKDYVLIPDSVTVNRDEATTVYKAIAVRSRSPEVFLTNCQKKLPSTRNTLDNYLNEVWNNIKDAPNLYSQYERKLTDPFNPGNDDNASICLFDEIDSTGKPVGKENWAIKLKKEYKNINGVDFYEFTMELPKELDDKLNSNEKIGFTVYKFIDDGAGQVCTPFKLGSSCLMNTNPELVENKTPIGPFLMDRAISCFESGQELFDKAVEHHNAFLNKLKENLKQSNKTVITKEELNKAMAAILKEIEHI